MKVKAKYNIGKWLTEGAIYTIIEELATQYVIIGNGSPKQLAHKEYFDIVQEETPMTRIEDVMVEVPLHMLTAMTKVCGLCSIETVRKTLMQRSVDVNIQEVNYIDIHVGDTYYQRAVALLDEAHKEYNSQFIVVEGKKYINADYEAALASLKDY